MRAINVLLTIVVSAALAVLLLEGGLRLLGMGPHPTINRFDEHLGWSKTPGATTRRSTSEFDVRYTINSLGLRDDEMRDPGKPSGRFRALFLGDSFVLGYTVDRDDLFVDVLERWWKDEGRDAECVNGGTEGWSTDQEVLWYERYGKDYMPDLVVLCPYENDLYWNGQTSYLRFPKPRFEADGTVERRALIDPGPEPAIKRWAIGNLVAHGPREPEFEVAPGLKVRSEWACYFRETPEVMRDAYARTKGALTALKANVESRGARLIVAPIPSRECIQTDSLESFETQFGRSGFVPSLQRWVRGKGWAPPAALARDRWSPDEPVERVLAACKELDVATIDPRAALKQAREQGGEPLYFRGDFHLNAAGNRAFARVLHDELDARGVFPAGYAAKHAAPMPPSKPPPLVRGWMIAFAALWLGLSVVYRFTYPKDPAWKGPVIVGGMLTTIFAIALGGGWLLGKLSPGVAQAIGILLIVVIGSFLLIKLGRRLGTVAELLFAFTKRGHWYLMPLVVVLLTVGSLLVVAASSPLVAPFIYTLF